MRLKHKILLFSGVAVTTLLAAAVLFVSARLESVALEQSGRNLDRVARAIDLLAEARFQKRRAVLSEWARSTAHTEDSDGAESPRPRGEPSLASSPQHDFLLSYSHDGELLASTPEIQGRSVSLLADAGPTAKTLAGVARHGLWNLDGRFFEVVAIAVAHQAADPGVLVAGDKIGDIVDEIHAITGAEVVLLAGDEVVESTLPGESIAAVLGALSAGDDLLTVNGERYLVGSHEMKTDLGGGACRHLILQPVAEILQPTREAVRELVTLGIVAWSGFFVLAAFGSRSVTLPLARLTQAMAGMAEQGEVLADFPSCGGGYEVAVLEATFRRLAGRLSEAQKDREKSYREAITAIVVALDARDHGTYGHSLRVASFATHLAERSGFPKERMASVQWGALLHDVGKIAVPDPILQKPGRLDESEWTIMRLHPEWGEKIVSRVAFLRTALPIVRSHHESWDGSGYPQGLHGRDIPIEARIFAIVDTYDAITSSRPYRQGRSHSEAMKELRRVSGIQLDPDLVGIFCSIPGEELAAMRLEVAETLGSSTQDAVHYSKLRDSPPRSAFPPPIPERA